MIVHLGSISQKETDVCFFCKSCIFLRYYKEFSYLIIENRIETTCVDEINEFNFVENPFVVDVAPDIAELQILQASSILKQRFAEVLLYEFWVECDEM